MRNTPAYSSSKRKISVLAFSALPSSVSVTSTSVSDIGLAPTLIWMPSCGCVPGVNDCGAFGFSNERSLMYCATTWSCGWGGAALGAAPPGGAPPLVVVIGTPRRVVWGLRAFGKHG